MEPKWTGDSVCPACGGEIHVKLFQKGIRVDCKSCKFKIYPKPGDVSESLVRTFLDETVTPLIKDVRSHLNKCKSSPRRGEDPQ